MQETELDHRATSSGRIMAADIITDLRAIRQLEGVFDGLDSAARGSPARPTVAPLSVVVNMARRQGSYWRGLLVAARP